jgi:hypothetical protein
MSRPFRHRLEDALVGGHLEHNLGLVLHLCAFRLHHIPKAIIDRHEYERKPTKILYLQASWGRAITFHLHQRRVLS